MSLYRQISLAVHIGVYLILKVDNALLAGALRLAKSLVFISEIRGCRNSNVAKQ